MARKKLKAPFPAFGGKQRVADLIWARLGDCANVIEPFANSAAFLLARPHPPRIETLNDLDAYIANFWRATQHDPEAVAEYADGPVNEADLHARHRWLVLSPAAADFRQKMRSDPEYFDPKVAGWWCWGACCWIGSGWCATAASAEWDKRPHIGGGEERTHIGAGVHGMAHPLSAKRPILAGPANESGERTHLGLGVHAKGPGLHEKRPMIAGFEGQQGRGVHAKRPKLSGKGKGNEGPYYGQGVHAKGPSEQIPMLTGGWKYGGRGVHQDQIPDGHCPQLADADGPGQGVHAKGPGLSQKRPGAARATGNNDGGNYRGVHAKGPGLSQQIPSLAAWQAGCVPDATAEPHKKQGWQAPGEGTCAARRAWLVDWFSCLRDRLRTVRVCCGDWLRVCDSPSVTTRLGLTGIFLDPPYGTGSDRTANLYGHDSLTVAAEVRTYCLERGDDPLMRLCLAGYAGEGHEELEAQGWEVVAWQASGGYGNRSRKGKANAARERLWFSPHTLGIEVREPMPLFDGLEEA